MIEDALKEIENAQKLSTAVLLNYYYTGSINKDSQIDAIQDRARMCNTVITKLKAFLLDRSKHVSN